MFAKKAMVVTLQFLVLAAVLPNPLRADDEKQKKIDATKAVIGELYQAENANNPPGSKTRAFHAKGTCAAVKFIPEKNIPKEIYVGAFAQGPLNGYLRFSNGMGGLLADYLPDVRGEALKLTGVKGKKLFEGEGWEKETQDFIGINYPIFFASNENFAQVGKALVASAKGDKTDLLKLILSETITRRVLLTSTSMPTVSYLRMRTWSETPWKIGEKYVKYSFQPCKGHEFDFKLNLPKTLEEAKYYLQGDVVSTLAPVDAAQAEQTAACLTMAVQIQEDPKTQSISDPQNWWAEPGYFEPVRGIILPDFITWVDLKNMFAKIKQNPMLRDEKHLQALIAGWEDKVAFLELLGSETVKDVMQHMPAEYLKFARDERKVTPFQKVATILVPYQDVTKIQKLCENFSMNPSHALEEMAPAEMINEMRKPTYTERSAVRHQENKTVAFEPTGDVKKDLAEYERLNPRK